ncbi:GNAT family N-acetyltransferase [Rhizobium sp.]
MNSGYRVEPLGSHHDRASFGCGVVPLDRYLREQAGQDMKRLISSCFVLINEELGQIAGYYTLAATSILAEDVSPEIVRKLPRYPVLPAALVGRLAVDERFRRQGLGSVLIADAAIRIMRGDVKAFAVVVDAKDDEAASFYRFQGFQPLLNRPLTLFLPLATFRKALAASQDG